MVDALRRARRIVAPDGVIVDVHPTPSPATVEVGDRLAGFVNAADGCHRHAAAGAALAAAVRVGWLIVERTAEFDFRTYGDSIDELRDYIEDHWRDAHIDAETVMRARELTRLTPGARPHSRERVVLTVARPGGQP